MKDHRALLDNTRILLCSFFLTIVSACGNGGEEVVGRNEAIPVTPEPTGPAMVTVPEDTPFSITPALPGSAPDNSTLGLEIHPDQEAMTAEFEFTVSGFDLKDQTPDASERGCANSPDGQHIHFILNNKPYLAKYEAEFQESVDPGHNVLLAFLSRSYHESVKSSGAFVVTEFDMKGGGGVPSIDLKRAPTLFYSRPKGDYSGKDGRKVLLDFYLVNTDLSESGYRVRATIDGHPVILTRWAPYFIEGLGLGEHTVRLELIDDQEALVPGPFNDSGERTFRVLEG